MEPTKQKGRKVELTVYKYAELSDSAKVRARNWLRELNAGDTFFAEFSEDAFRDALKALGFTLNKRHGRDSLYWSGFRSQGDGASFEGTWYASDFAPGELLADRPVEFERDGKRETCAVNVELHRIAGVLRALKTEGFRYAEVRASHLGHHMACEGSSLDTDAADSDPTPEQDERFIGAVRDLARMFYGALEAEYDYQNSDEQIAESLEANEHEFTADGKVWEGR